MPDHHVHIHQVPGVRGANAFLISQPVLTLVDTGLPGSGRAVLEFMAALGHQPHDLKRILLTHRHLDHAGGAASLRQETGAEVCAHAGDVESDASGAQMLRTMQGRVTVAIDRVLRDGEVLEGGIEVVHAGGHTAGSAAYYLAGSRSLFLGDMAINNIDRLSRPIAFSNEDSEAYELGLARLAVLNAEAGYFGHGPVVASGLQEALLALQARARSPLPLAMLRYAGLWLRRRIGV